MKNILITFVLLVLFIGAFLSFADKKNTNSVFVENITTKPIMRVPEHILDPQCKMKIESVKHSAQVVLQDQKTYFFDDVGCMVLWLKELHTKEMVFLYVFSEDTQKWIDASKACYKIGIHTPMHYGFGAYEMEKDNCITFEEFKLKMYRGETMANPTIRKKYLGK